ncbi:MAG: MotA/TolQ/ExbB proton channel family protein [Thiotrichaceae bacterium]
MQRDVQRDANYPFYGWLLIVGVVIFGAYLLWDFKLLHRLIKEDATYLSSFILLFFVTVTLYLGLAARQLSRQRGYVQQLTESTNATTDKIHSESWALEHLQLMQWGRKQATNESESLLARLVEQVHQGHTSGWFLSDILMRLGLIGTVIGFVLMLGSVYELKQDNVDALQSLLATMGSGMQVALYTTLTGLGTALVVGIQCQWLDRCADSLISQIIKLGVQSEYMHSQPDIKSE